MRVAEKSSLQEAFDFLRGRPKSPKGADWDAAVAYWRTLKTDEGARFDKIVELVKDRHRPIQFIFAGKAHPRDDEGKRFIQHIIHLSKYSDLQGHLVFLENYDMHVARQMVAGCDVWLNTPRRPKRRCLRHPTRPATQNYPSPRRQS